MLLQPIEASGFSHNTCLPALHGGVGHGEVQIVGRTNVDRAHVSVGQQILVIARGSLDAKVVGELARCLGGAPGNADHFDVAQAAQRLGMDAAHEADAKIATFGFCKSHSNLHRRLGGDGVYDKRARRSRIIASFPMNSWGT